MTNQPIYPAAEVSDLSTDPEVLAEVEARVLFARRALGLLKDDGPKMHIHLLVEAPSEATKETGEDSLSNRGGTPSDVSSVGRAITKLFGRRYKDSD